MSTNGIIGIRVPADVRAWIEQESKRRKMTITDYCLRLMIMGIKNDSIESAIEQLQQSVDPMSIQREILRQTLATRFIVEQQAKGVIKNAQTIGYDANVFADRELEKLEAKKGQA